MADEPNNTGLKDLIFNRRYKAWRQWFYCLTGLAVICAFKSTDISFNLFRIYAIAATAGLGALIGGLSVTDWMKAKNGGDGQ